MRRRDLLALLAAAALAPRAGHAESPGLRLGARAVPFDADLLADRARALAGSTYVPRPEVPASWRDLDYDDYRRIWFAERHALWQGTDRPQRVDLFAPGLYFPRGVAIHVVSGGSARPVLFDPGVFDTTDDFPRMTIDDTLGYSGLRLRAELERPGVFTEYAVFQGASYFRGIGTGGTYGLSARALAIDTADPAGEEFPDFTAFWLEEPAPGSGVQVLHALLDSPSVTGAYRFEIAHGPTLGMRVTAQLFAREDVTHLGIAPLTSMFLFDDTMRSRFSDFRPAVHDSDGLLIHNGADEVIWRPLANPAALQVSAFADRDPRGFGLMQRKRRYADFTDLESLYHNRPGVWITPGEGWGRGSVALVEIPADREIYDNIVAYWRPSGGLPAGAAHAMGYTLHWGADPAPPSARMPCRVLNTAMGARPEGGEIVVIDFSDAPQVPSDLGRIEVVLRTGAGTVGPGVLQRNPETNGPRLAFTFQPGTADLAEFRAQLRLDGAALSEVWLYRWTRA